MLKRVTCWRCQPRSLPEARFHKRRGPIAPHFPPSTQVRYCRYPRWHRSELPNWNHPQPRSGIADIPVGTGRNYRTGIDFLPNFPDPESRCTLEGGARKLGFVYHSLWFCNLGIHIRRTPRRTPRRSPTVTNMCICMLTRIPGVALVHTSGKPILKGTRKEQRHYLSLGLNFGVELVEVNLPQFAHLFQN